MAKSRGSDEPAQFSERFRSEARRVKLLEEIRWKLPEDTNLIHFTLTKIAEEGSKLKLRSAEVTAILWNHEVVTVSNKDKPTNRLVCTHDGFGGFAANWEAESVKRHAHRWANKRIDEFFNFLGSLAGKAANKFIGSNPAPQAITYK